MRALIAILAAAVIVTGCASLEKPLAKGALIWEPIGKLCPNGEMGNGVHWTGAGAEGRIMNMLSDGMPKGSFDDKRNTMKQADADFVMLIACNSGDGQYAGYNIYQNNDVAGGQVDKGKVKRWREKIWKLRADGRRVGICFFTDDDRLRWNRIDPDRQIRDVVDAFDDQVCAYMLAIEPADSGWSAAYVRDRIAYAKTRTKHPVGAHDHSGSVNLIANSGADFAAVQCWHPKDVVRKSPADLEHSLNSFRARLPAGMDINAFEWGIWSQDLAGHIKEMHKAVERSPAKWSGSSGNK